MIKQDFKILFAGGGTGGHLFSGIAVAEEMKKKFPESQALFVGTRFGLEKDIIPQTGFPLKFIEASPLKGSGIFLRIKSLLRLPKAYFQSKKILKDFKPDIVIGIGGYASGPMTLAAHYNKVFTAIIEQNAFPGFTNRHLSRFVNKVFIAFSKAKEFFDPEKTILTGNPSRIFSSSHSRDPAKLTVFILGGSQGAHTLNQSMMDALPQLKASGGKFHFIHQTGTNDFPAVKEAYQRQGLSAEVFPFNEKVGPFYSQADLALCRAGSGTITELTLQGLPAILVPYPYAADNHQLFNAQELVNQGACELIENKNLDGSKVAERLIYYLKNKPKLEEMGKKAALFSKPRAAEEVLNHCLLALS